MQINAKDFINTCEKELQIEYFNRYHEIALFNQEKVLNAFKMNKVALYHFAGTTGYGYDDIGRDTLNKVFADVFCAEQAIVSPHILSGTHALTIGLFGILRPNDIMLSITGAPYDTMKDVILGEGNGSLKDFNILYEQVDLINGKINIENVLSYIKNNKVKLIYIQRSRGYSFRQALSIAEIKEVCSCIKKIDKNICIFVDNCYGEFVEVEEPTQAGADIVVGSLIKNAGGGIAPNGGYIAGKQNYMKQVEGRLTAPSVGGEIGSYAGGYQYFFQGIFLAPHVTCQAIKGALLFSKAFSSLGYKTMPHFTQNFYDIICAIEFNDEKELIAFCRAIQSISPIDSHVVPEAWAMPGYEDKIIMAAGCFVQGASIELSADSPIKKPYIAYFQGGLTYEHVKLAAIHCVEAIQKL